MKRWIRVLTLIVASSVAGSAGAALDVPSPANSSVDPCLVVCPAGEIVFRVVVRDLNHNPVVNSQVVIDFCGCPNVVLCPLSLTDPYVRLGACQIVKIAGAQGIADFAIRAGGGCASLGARVYADGILLAQRNVASPDQDGNLVVEVGDLALADAKRGSADPTADFDCDGLVTSPDVDSVVPHGKHDCPPPDPTPALPRSWGEVKVIYR